MIQKFKTVSLGWNTVSRLFQTLKLDGNVHFFSSRPFLASFIQKTHLAFWRTYVTMDEFLIINGLSISTLWSKVGFGVEGQSWIWS